MKKMLKIVAETSFSSLQENEQLRLKTRETDRLRETKLAENGYWNEFWWQKNAGSKLQLSRKGEKCAMN